MRIMVAGCGKIGTTILESLLAEEHDLVVMDSDPAVVEEITNTHDVIGVCGSATDCRKLEEAEVAKAELFVAVTGSDELNMLSCFIARKMGAKHTVARIRSAEYTKEQLQFMQLHLPLSMAINPEYSTAQALFNILKMPSAVKVETFSRRSFEMVELILKPDSRLIGRTLEALRQEYPVKFLVCVVQRGKETFIPDGSCVLQVGDRIGISSSPAEIHRLFKALGCFQKHSRKVMILGASRTAVYLARMLLNNDNSVKIIERNPKRCAEICDVLPDDAVVIQGDGMSQDLLKEEGLSSQDALVSLTGMDEENILSSVYAMTQGVPKTIAKVNRNELADMAEKLGLDCIVSPREIVANMLVRYARALQNSLGSTMETLYGLMDGMAEALEFNVLPDSKLLNTPLKDLKLKPRILIAGIIRRQKPVIPDGDTVILPWDKLIVIAAGQRICDLEDIIK